MLAEVYPEAIEVEEGSVLGQLVMLDDVLELSQHMANLSFAPPKPEVELLVISVVSGSELPQ